MSTIGRWWRYLGTKIGMTLEESADPKVQLEQAIADAREQHRMLAEQAANVIANQTQLQMRLDRALDEYAKATASARQALVLADEARKAEGIEKAADYERAAASYATRIVELEGKVEELKGALVGAAEASERAKQVVADNAVALQRTLSERERLLSRLDQAKMQEQMNAAMRQLSQPVGGDTPSLDEIRTKIDRRLATAQAMTEVSGASVDIGMLEVERAQAEAESASRLAAMREQMGLEDPATRTTA